MIFTDGLRLESPDRPVTDFAASWGAQLGATAAEAWSDSPTSQILGITEINAARGGARAMPETDILGSALGGPQAAEEGPSVPTLSRADAVERLKQAGLDKRVTLPAQDTIATPVLDIMMQRARERAERDATIERGPQGFFAGAAELGTSFLVGAVDPINLASAFIPVMGELRYGKLLASAGESVIARNAARAGVGAAQGVVGQAVLEPLDWYAHTQEGRDFGMSDVLRNLVFGAVLGAGLQTGGGIVADVFRSRRGRPLYPYDLGEPLEYHTPWEELRAGAQPPPIPRDVVGEFPGIEKIYQDPVYEGTARIIDDLPPRAKEDSMRAAIAAITQGEPVKVGEMLQAAAKSDPRIAESFERANRPVPTAPDPLDLAMNGELTADRARAVSADLKQQQRAVEDQIFGGRAEEWRKLNRKSDRAWDKADDGAARMLDEEIASLERDVGLTAADEDWLDGKGWSDHTVSENWDNLARSLQDIENGRDDAIAAGAAAVRNLPKTRNWDRMNNLEREAVLTVLGGMNEENKAGRDPQAFLRDVFQERIKRYGGGADAREVVDAQMREMAALLSGPLEREPQAGAGSARMETKISINGREHHVDYGARSPSHDDWHNLLQRAAEHDEPDVIAASRAADETPEVKTRLDDRVAAAAKAETSSAELFKLLENGLSEEQRLRLADGIRALDDEHKLDADVIERAAACAFRART